MERFAWKAAVFGWLLSFWCVKAGEESRRMELLF